MLLYERFTGPCVTNSLGKAFFDAADAAAPVHPDIEPVNVADNGAIAAAGFAGGGPSASALYHLRRLQTFEDKKRSTLDAMRYSASVGLTAHLDQVLFPTPGPLHPNQILSNLDQYRMYDSWLALHREGKTIIRLQMNFLQNQNDPALPELKERLRNQFQFFGDDMLMTGSIGEWAAPLGSGAVWREAQRLVAQAGWRNENSVQRPRGPARRSSRPTRRSTRSSASRGLRWMVHHVPVVNADLLTPAPGARLRRADGGVPLGHLDRSEGHRRRAVPDHRRSRHPGRHPRRRRPHRAAEPVAAHLLRDDGRQLVRRPGQRRPADHPAGGAAPVHARQQLVPAHGRQDRLDRAGKLADLAVLNDDYFAVPDERIKQIRSVLTIVDGKIVHDAGVVK